MTARRFPEVELERSAPPDPRHTLLPTFSIRQLADEFQVTTRTLRYYEAQGLMRPQRLGTVRIYSTKDRERIAEILRAREIGLSVRDIGDLIRIHEREGEASRNAMAAPLLAERLRALQAERLRIDNAIAAVTALCARLGVDVNTHTPGETPPTALRRFRTSGGA
jgi:DNA-binding transcriptional MerR regulator